MLRGIFAWDGRISGDVSGVMDAEGDLQEHGRREPKTNAGDLMALHLALSRQRPDGWQSTIVQDEHDGGERDPIDQSA